MAISYVGANIQHGGGGFPSSKVTTLPAGSAAGDIIIVSLLGAYPSSGGYAGCTLLATTSQGIVLWKQLTSGDITAGNITFTSVSGQDYATMVSVWRTSAAWTATPVAGDQSQGSTSNVPSTGTGPGFTAQTGARKLVHHILGYYATASSAPSGTTSRLSGRHQAGSWDVGYQVADVAQAAGSVSPASDTISGFSAGTYTFGSFTLADNTAPTAPTVTAPNGGETINASTSVTWTAGTDADGDALTYDLDYTRDNGATWVNVATGLTGTSYTWNTSAITPSTACRVRLRSNDGLLTSSYDESNANFTIQHNVAPTAPTGLSPSSGTIDRAITQRFSWTFNDPNPGDTQSKFDLQYRIGTGAWTTVTVTTTSPFYDFAPSTFSAANYEWQVRTYDALGVVSPWSASAFFTAGNAPSAPTITSPTSGSTIGTNTGVIAWSAPTQASYQVRKVADSAGSPDTGTVYYDSGEVVSSTARNAALSFPTNSRYEHLQVRIKVSGLWSTWASVRVQVSYTPPPTPTLTTSVDSTVGRIGVVITNPAPTGTQPALASNEVYRRETSVGGAGIRLAVGVAGNSTWFDYTAASRVAYQYKVVAHGVNGVDSTSAWTS